MQYRVAEEKDMSEIAKVHMECFPEYFTTLFGQKLLTAYYKEFYEEAPLFVIAENKEQIVGFCMGYKRGTSKAKNEFINKNRYKLAFRMAYLCITLNRLAIKKCVQFIFEKLKITRIKQNHVTEADGDLLSICVKKEYRGQGVSTQLIKMFEQTLKDNGMHSYVLSVYKTNASARVFYEKNGLVLKNETDDELKFFKMI